MFKDGIFKILHAKKRRGEPVTFFIQLDTTHTKEVKVQTRPDMEIQHIPGENPDDSHDAGYLFITLEEKSKDKDDLYQVLIPIRYIKMVSA